jgi:2-oxoglutarate ferredoxin oxidoreductase subunit beta
MSVSPHEFAKISGIGCSSKTPNYFLGSAHGLNSVHGRMPSVATGANMANRSLRYIGVSGDGDSASIGLGQFCHVVRRNINMLYIVDNNGTYGLTKGQFSATNDKGSTNKRGVPNVYQAIDLVTLALEIGATFVARSFSGDKKQLIPLIKAGLAHNGLALIDVISPCVAFNNHQGSTKSYRHVREHEHIVNVTGLIPDHEEITVDYQPGTTEEVTMPDGSTLHLAKLAPSYDPRNRLNAINYLQAHKSKGEVVTGLLYLDPRSEDCHDILGTIEQPLHELDESTLCPGEEILAAINAGFR